LGVAEKKIIEGFWEAMNAMTDAERLVFFSRVFTPTEIKMFAKRVAILKALEAGMNYDEIRDKLAVMPSTIGKMSNIIHRSGTGISAIVQKLIAASISNPKKRSRGSYGSRTLAGTQRSFGF
jgi:uncharacterized protein YerC